VLARADLNKI